MQPTRKDHSAGTGIKRPAQELISPLACHKAQRNDTAKSAHISAHKPPSLAHSESEPEVNSSKSSTHHILKQHPQLKLPKYTMQPSNSPCVVSVPKKPTLELGVTSKSHINREQTPRNKESICWPHEFKVYQVHNSFIQICDMLRKATTCGTSKKSHPKYSITVEQAFFTAFPKADFKKAMLYDHRDHWATYDRQIIDLFID